MAQSKVCIVGIGGRMGGRVLRLLQNHQSLVLASGVERHEINAVNVPVFSDAEKAIALCDVVIDFSAPAACTQIAPICAKLGKKYVCASTALTKEDEQALNDAAKKTAVLQAANLSLGVNVLLELVELAAKRLGVHFDVEIGEIHHRHKRDAPSGTSLALGKAVQLGYDGEMQEVLARHEGVRQPHELGYSALRGGDVSGDHTVYFLGEGERLELTHRSSSADIFAAGALKAAAFVVQQSAGRYSMRDALR